MRPRACDLSLYDGNVDHSLRRHRYANCDDPEEEKWIHDIMKHVNCSMKCDNKDAFSPILTPFYWLHISPVLSLHLVISVKVEYALRCFFTPGQQESSRWVLLQSQTGQQLRARLDLHPIHHFGENRKYRGDGDTPRVIWEEQQMHVCSGLQRQHDFCQYPMSVVAAANTDITILQWNISRSILAFHQYGHRQYAGRYAKLFFIIH